VVQFWKTHGGSTWKVTKTTGIVLGILATGLGLFVDFRETTEIFEISSVQGDILNATVAPPPSAAAGGAPICGNGIIDEGEDCDNGTGQTGALCARDCTSNLVLIKGGSLLRGYSEQELKDGLHLRIPSRRSAEYLRGYAAPSTPATPIQYEKFWLMRTEVTWSAMNAFLDDDGPRLDPIPPMRGKPAWGRFPRDRPEASVQWHLSAMKHARDQMAGIRGQPELPARADLISAVAFCAWLGGHLPTEGQWEAAARGRNGRRTFPWGERVPRSSPEDCDLMNGFFHTSMNPPVDFNCGGREVSEVGTHPAGCTPEGVCDLAGNMDEYVTPGAVVWREVKSDLLDGDTWIAAYPPGPMETEEGELEFLRTCSWNAVADPYGMVTGQVSDCVLFSGDNPTTPVVTNSHPADRVRAVVRGGNFNDSLPVLYQTRARYPYVDPNQSKGFRCVL
jgi:formylglycine-generating enzyme required for sulfatase activity